MGSHSRAGHLAAGIVPTASAVRGVAPAGYLSMKPLPTARLCALAAACACALWLASPLSPLSAPSPHADASPSSPSVHARPSPAHHALAHGFSRAAVFPGEAAPEPRNAAQAKLGRGQLLHALQWFEQRRRGSGARAADAALQIAALDRVGLPPSHRDGENVMVGIDLALRYDAVVEPVALARASAALQRRLDAAGLRAYAVPGSPALLAAVPLARLEWLAGLDAVAAIRLAPQANAATVSAGVAASGAELLRGFGEAERIPEAVRRRLDGAGLTVAVIDSFGRSRAASLREAGEWPAAADTVEIPANGRIFGHAESSHGNSVTEIVYDFAPGAKYRLYDVGDLNDEDAPFSLINWTRAIQDAANLDANNQRLGPPRAQVINTSLGEIGSAPGDGTGGAGEAQGLYQAIDAARANGVVMIVAAGNSAHSYWDGQATAGAAAPVAQDFDPDDGGAAPVEVNVLRLSPLLRSDDDAELANCVPFYADPELGALHLFQLSLTWSDWPTRWSNAASDYRLQLVRWTDGRNDRRDGERIVAQPAGWTVVAQADAPQDGRPGALPTERLSYAASAADHTRRCDAVVANAPPGSVSGAGIFGVRIVRKTPSAGHFLRLFLSTVHELEHGVMARSLDSPADSPQVLTVGATSMIDFIDASYSSRGPVLGPGGVLPVAPSSAPKPDLTSYTMVATRGGYMDGTSAAAPHAAGLAALALQHHRQVAMIEARKAAQRPAATLGWHAALAETSLTGVMRPDATPSQRQALAQVQLDRRLALADATERTLKAVAGARGNRMSAEPVDNVHGYGLLRFDDRSPSCFFAQMYAADANARAWLVPQYLQYAPLPPGEAAYDELHATYLADCAGD
ncbi:S8 family serine peptidase [Lysobacter yananisis]|uniref:S8 family serine peptidase n=1 Tax=Lysobacter yananisis TaxID=1003114 RepID=A0ABY9PFJ9_9GAMM|nr:S8 family serine peptidase [Lysobacter yananisis]WMT04991.1 S8 family serine peptidase [Lysobacter yananisis]